MTISFVVKFSQGIIAMSELVGFPKIGLECVDYKSTRLLRNEILDLLCRVLVKASRTPGPPQSYELARAGLTKLRLQKRLRSSRI